MFSKLFNWRKKDDEVEELPVSKTADWAFLGADMHSHFIPGIDDGVKTVEESITLLRAMKAMGYNTIITTPHVMVDYYPNTTQIIQDGLLTVQKALKENNIDLTLKAAAEYYIDESFIKLLDTEPLLTIHEKEVLVEFSMLYEPPMLLDVIFKMISSGYRPIIAHPERYMFFHKDMSKYKLLRDRGCLFQLNMLSVCGYYGPGVRTAADELMRKGMYDYCGTDIHHEKHVSAIKGMARSRDHHIIIGYPFLNQRLCSQPV